MAKNDHILEKSVAVCSHLGKRASSSSCFRLDWIILLNIGQVDSLFLLLHLYIPLPQYLCHVCTYKNWPLRNSMAVTCSDKCRALLRYLVTTNRIPRTCSHLYWPQHPCHSQFTIF